MILYLTINLFDSGHDFIRDPLTSDTKDSFLMDYHVLIMTYENLTTRSPKDDILDMTLSLKGDCEVNIGLCTVDI